ncbi:hypothetical protein JavanS723_0016 [Streptococcus satellite phage Javan723]|nr:hypothetical protein JavanS723_0016 [Streptococcus satellite phage Javan723]
MLLSFLYFKVNYVKHLVFAIFIYVFYTLIENFRHFIFEVYKIKSLSYQGVKPYFIRFIHFIH